MLKGYQFDRETVNAGADGSVYSFLNANRSEIIEGRGSEFLVTTSGLNATISSGEAIIMGRLVKITGSETIAIPANSSGYLVIEIDLSKTNNSTGTVGQSDYIVENNQLNIKFVTQLVQDDLNNGGLLYHFNLGNVSSSTSSLVFTKNAIAMKKDPTFIIATGTSGIWNYIKYSNGSCHLWGKTSKTFPTANSAGQIFSNPATMTEALPFNVYNGVSNVSLSGGSLKWTSAVSTSNTAISFWVLSPISRTSDTHQLCYMVDGFWKQ